MKLPHFVALGPLLLLATAALGQGTAEQQAACAPDAFRLCRSDFPNVEAITACMKRERDNLSAACRAVMNDAEGGTQQAAAPPPAPQTPAPKAAEGPSPATAPTRQTATVAPPASAAKAEDAPPTASAKVAGPPAPSEAAPAAATPASAARPQIAQQPPSSGARAVAGRRTTAVTSSASRPRATATRRVAAVRRRPAREGDVARETDAWMRDLGLGGLPPSAARDMRRLAAFFDGRL